MSCGILIPQPGIKSMLPEMKAQSPNHWTTREIPFFPLALKGTHMLEKMLKTEMQINLINSPDFGIYFLVLLSTCMYIRVCMYFFNEIKIFIHMIICFSLTYYE